MHSIWRPKRKALRALEPIAIGPLGCRPGSVSLHTEMEASKEATASLAPVLSHWPFLDESDESEPGQAAKARRVRL